MSLRFLNEFTNQQRLFFRKKKTAGFTLIELLIVSILGSMVVSGLLWVMNDMLRENQRELALSSTQQDMKRALAFIEEDLRESVYTYDGDGLNSILPYLPSTFTDAGTVPILAFWKVEAVPYSASESLPVCSGTGSTVPASKKDECEALKIERRAYTLVIYLLSTTDTNPKTWQGQSRITRYQLRKYGNLSDLTRYKRYADPRLDSTFENWPKNIDNFNAQATTGTTPPDPIALVDFVALSTDSDITSISCPTGDSQYDYQATPRDPTNPKISSSKSFFACVGTNQNDTANQDVIIFLTGNAKGNAGLNKEELIAPLKTQVINRGVIEKIVNE